MIHRLTYSGGAQSVRSVVLRDDGRPVAPASATYAVVDLRYDADDASHTVESGSATVDSTSTTLSAAAGRTTTNPRQVTVASATGITAGRRYLISYGGWAEEVRVAAVSGTTVVLTAPLTRSWASGAAFAGLELSATVTSDTCANDDYLDEPNVLAIRWTPSGYQPYVEAIHLERLQPALLVAPEEVLKLDGTLHAYADDNMSIADALRQAQDDFNVEMLCHGIDDDEFLSGPVGRRAIIHCAAYHVLKSSSDASAVDRAAKYHARWEHLVSELVSGWDKAKTRRLNENAVAQAPDLRSRWAGRW